MFFVLGGTLGLSLLIFGLRLGAVGIHFGVYLRFWGQALDTFFDVAWKDLKKVQKRIEKGN